ncbi:hypothetical protein AB4K20DRAFT_1862661 [Rhizopus microsporus]
MYERYEVLPEVLWSRKILQYRVRGKGLYLPCDPVNPEVYECRKAKMKDILALLWKYSDLFDKKNANSLGKWLRSSKASLLNVLDTKRVIMTDSSENNTVLFRDLFVIKDEFISGSKFNFNIINTRLKELVPDFMFPFRQLWY